MNSVNEKNMTAAANESREALNICSDFRAYGQRSAQPSAFHLILTLSKQEFS